MPVFTIRAMGVSQAAVRFNRMGSAAIDATFAMERVANLMLQIERKIFDSEGRRGGGSWKRVSEGWFDRKMKEGLDLRTGHATLALKRSMSVRGADHQVLVVTKTTVNLKSDLPYAKTQQRHRPFIKFTPADRAQMSSIIRNHLISAWRAPA